MQTAEKARELGEALQQRGWWVTAAESCTGGGVAVALTDIAGSSRWFAQSWVSYSNLAKHEMLGVDKTILRRCGALSEKVVRAMAQGARTRARAQLAIAISGIAGPGGGSPGSPVGTVWFAWELEADGEPLQVRTDCQRFDGNRLAVRAATVAHALGIGLEMLMECQN